MVHQCLKAAQVLEQEDGLEVEVIDLRSLSPLDREAILESVKHTNKVLIVHEDTLTGGICAELAAIMAQGLFEISEGPDHPGGGPEWHFSFGPPIGGTPLSER